jgi:hypothetical protein
MSRITFPRITFPRAELETAHPVWFSRSSLRWWRTRLPKFAYRDLDGAVWFVSSDRTYFDGRAYTVRKATAEGIETVGPFQGYDTADKAARAIVRALKA